MAGVKSRVEAYYFHCAPSLFQVFAAVPRAERLVGLKRFGVSLRLDF